MKERLYLVQLQTLHDLVMSEPDPREVKLAKQRYRLMESRYVKLFGYRPEILT